jgi:hypothetical protein
MATRTRLVRKSGGEVTTGAKSVTAEKQPVQELCFVMSVQTVHRFLSSRELREIGRLIGIIVFVIGVLFIANHDCEHSSTRFDFTDESRELVEEISYFNASNQSVVIRPAAGTVVTIILDVPDIISCTSRHHSRSDSPTIVASVMLVISFVTIILLLKGSYHSTGVLPGTTVYKSKTLRYNYAMETLAALVDFTVFGLYLGVHQALLGDHTDKEDAEVLMIASSIGAGVCGLLGFLMCVLSYQMFAAWFAARKEGGNPPLDLKTSVLMFTQTLYADSLQIYFSLMIQSFFMTVFLGLVAFLSNSSNPVSDAAEIHGMGLLYLAVDGVNQSITSNGKLAVSILYDGPVTTTHRIYTHTSAIGVFLLAIMCIVLVARIASLCVYIYQRNQLMPVPATPAGTLPKYSTNDPYAVSPSVVHSAMDTTMWFWTTLISVISSDIAGFLPVVIFIQTASEHHILKTHFYEFLLPVTCLLLVSLFIKIMRFGAVSSPLGESRYLVDKSV